MPNCACVLWGKEQPVIIACLRLNTRALHVGRSVQANLTWTRSIAIELVDFLIVLVRGGLAVAYNIIYYSQRKGKSIQAAVIN